ncbi:MAG: sulfurtransferase TusA family protein [Anaerolineae bacterium]|nr:sulfurtransferase TusA family protein [Anaerolineae bacterium]
MAHTVDARGLSCPQPVILTRNAIKAGDFPIEVLVETVTSRENVRRAAEKLGCTVRVEEMGDEFKLTLVK